MRIYIASSWKNQHGVEMLTSLFRQKGHEVISWIENNYGESHNHVTKKFDFETWVNSPESDQSFEFDTHGAGTCDVFIYYGPAGKEGICSRYMRGNFDDLTSILTGMAEKNPQVKVILEQALNDLDDNS